MLKATEHSNFDQTLQQQDEIARQQQEYFQKDFETKAKVAQDLEYQLQVQSAIK